MHDLENDDWTLDEERYRRVIEFARATRFYFRPRFDGFEALRGDRGMMVVANHGLFAFEGLSLLLGVWEHAGRPIRGMADRVLLATDVQRKLLGGTGAVEGTPENAVRLLSRGELLYVCPGGAREALASAKDRYKLFWEGHDGFVRCAIRAGTPIVPLGIVGIDEVYRQLIDAESMRETRFGQLLENVLGGKYVVPLYTGIGPLPFPLSLRFLLGDPIEVPDDPKLADDPDVVAELHERSRVAVERLLERGFGEREHEEANMKPGAERFFTRMLGLLSR